MVILNVTDVQDDAASLDEVDPPKEKPQPDANGLPRYA